MGFKYCVEFDDLCDNTIYAVHALAVLKQQYPAFKATLFAIPARCSKELIAMCKEQSEWLALAPHGWRHTRGECLSWTKEEAIAKIKAAADLGIDAPVFRAPAWLLDSDTYEACKELGYVVADHEVYRLPKFGQKTYTYNMLFGKAPQVRCIHGHLSRTPAVDNWILQMMHEGRLRFAPDSEFYFPWEVAVETQPHQEMPL